MEYSIWNAQILFLTTPVSSQSQSLLTMTALLNLCFARELRKTYFHQITLNEFEKDLLCQCL